MTYEKNEFVNRLVELRKGLTQEKFAERINALPGYTCSKSTIKKWEDRSDEKTFPSYNKINGICRALQCTPNQLFGYEKSTPKKLCSDYLGISEDSALFLRKLNTANTFQSKRTLEIIDYLFATKEGNEFIESIEKYKSVSQLDISHINDLVECVLKNKNDFSEVTIESNIIYDMQKSSILSLVQSTLDVFLSKITKK